MMGAEERERIERYAEVLVRVGINLQPGQPLVIRAGVETAPAPLEVAPFVHALVRQGYAAGASIVHVWWPETEVTRLTLLHAAEEQLAVYPPWMAAAHEQMVAQGAAFVALVGPDPHVFDGVSPARLTQRSRASAQALQPFAQAVGALAVRWLVAAAPTQAWASQVFPDLAPQEALRRLWGLIQQATRLDAPDPVAAWRDHVAALRRRQDALTAVNPRRLHYTGPGTDLWVDLLPRGRWVSGMAVAQDGVPCVPNMPTEEVFTTPRRGGAEGTVRSTLPLYLNSVLIEGIVLRFAGGRIVEATAESGQEVLTGALDTDEGARYLGEVALVPVDSAVARLGRVFYTTLFDENAACHLAFGRGLGLCVEGGDAMTPGELADLGVNMSAVHVDLMIGSPELDVDGHTEAGETVPLLRGGRWVLPDQQAG